MNYLVFAKELIALLWPLILEIRKALKEQKLNGIETKLVSAKTKDERRNVAKKIALYIYDN